MAKLHKIEMYILDIDEHYGSLEETISHINDRLELVSLHPYKVKTVEFDWSDEHKLNYNDCVYEDYSGMFGDESENVNKYKQLFKYYRKNPDKFVEDYTGHKLLTHQKILLKLWLVKHKLIGGK